MRCGKKPWCLFTPLRTNHLGEYGSHQVHWCEFCKRHVFVRLTATRPLSAEEAAGFHAEVEESMNRMNG
jgi:hypothetical protein